MNIQGLQKLTLLDYPGKVACTIFFGGCNFRCPFCHNASLVRDGGMPQPPLDAEEVLGFLEKRRGVLEGVCITGGEPLLQNNLKAFLKKLKAMGYAVKLDTNGSRPEQLRACIHEGLVDYVAMDIKNTLSRYGETIGLPDYDTSSVETAVQILAEDKVPYEFRTTVVREYHDLDNLMEIRKWIGRTPPYFLQDFVDSGDTLVPGLSGYDEDTLQAFAAALGEGVIVRGK